MSLGVDDYLTWTPADLAQGAVWLRLKANEMKMTATAIRSAAADGTAGQCGAFIDARRDEAHDIADRVQGLAELLGGAATELNHASADLGSAVAGLRDDCATIDDEGFERFDGFRVRDARTEYADAADRNLRERRAEELQKELTTRMGEIRERDEVANRVLHEVVKRPVRDRTDYGNGNPFVTGITPMSLVSGLVGAGTELVEGKWAEAAREAGRGMIQVRGLGPVMAVLGFAGAVAARPEDEPLFEAVIAEGIGTMAASAGAPLGFGFGLVSAGPAGAAGGTVVGAFGGGAFLGPLAASVVRGRFDRAN